MKCTYTLNNRTFNSELELEEYLIKNSPYLKDMGDVVFDRSNYQNFATNRLFEVHKKVMETTKTKVKVRSVEDIENMIINGDDIWDLDDMISLDTDSYITISDLIRSMSTVEGYQLTPVFRPEEYWKRAQVAFADIASFQEGSDYYGLIPFIFDKNSDGSYDIHAITDQEEFKKAREHVEFVWKTQSLIGTAVHNAISEYYKNCKDHDPEKFSSDRNKIKNRILENLKEKDKEYLKNHIDNILDICENFNKKLVDKFGKGCIVLPEYAIQGEGNFNGKLAQVVGRLDLIVLTEDGASIIDFKCSPKDYRNYNDIKVRTFDYQLAAYRRMLIESGLVSSRHKEKCSLYAVPIKFEGFRYDKESNSCFYDELSIEDDAFKELSVSSKTAGGSEYDTVETNLDQVFVPKEDKLLDVNGILTNVKDELDAFFPDVNNSNVIDDTFVKDYIERHGGIRPNSDGGFDFYWKKNPKYPSDILHKDTEKELITKIKDILISRQLRMGENTESIIKSLKEAWEKGDKRYFTYNAKNYRGEGNKEYTQDRLQKYADIKWKIFELPTGYQDILSSMGIILLENKYNNQIDVVKISSSDLEHRVKLGESRHTIFGRYLDDTRANNNNTQIKPLENFQGNIELIQAMAVLNQLSPVLADKIIGNIQVISPDLQSGMTSSNKQLLYNYSTLLRLSNKQNNFYYAGKGDIKMAGYVDLAKQKLQEILFDDTDNDSIIDNYKFKKFKGYIPKIDEYNNDFNKLYIQLDLLRKDMEKEFGSLLDSINTTLTEKNENEDPKYTLYRYILMGMGELKGITYSQQVQEHETILDGSVRKILTEGWNGTRIDNPGSLKNDNLNKLAELTMQQYDKVRQDLIRVNYKVRELTKKLKEDKQFGKIARYTFGNQTSMYSNMYDSTVKDDLYFRNPWEDDGHLSEVEKEYLKYAITLINMQRYNGITEDNIEDLVNADPDKYLRVPLTKGDLGAKTANNGGFLNMIRSRFKKLDLKNVLTEKWWDQAKDKIKDTVQNIYAESDENKIRQSQQWEMVSAFSYGEKEDTRKSELKKYGKDYYETNLEKLLLKHTQAYSAKEHLDQVFPLFKSIMLHISNQGIVKNEQFVKDLQYAQDFIKSKIFNAPLEDVDKWGFAQWAAKKLMQQASRIALWMNPRQLYQGIDGFWKDISLLIKNPDGKESFTKKNLTEAALWVYADIKHFGDDFTEAELLNQMYGLNDMDANTLADRLHQDTAGFFNLDSLGFRFSSRPDYYNRLTIFGAQMKGDGCFDAHHMVNGRLEYNWKEDKRFDKFANWTEEQYKNASAEDKAEYNKQKALYIAMAKEFVETGFKNPDGSDFVLDLNKKYALPRAYTNRQAESMKELADKIYGYYSHEKRSLIQSNTIGAMFFQMFTYASSKKNQYISGRLYNQEGEYEHYYDTYIDEEGKEQKNYWYQILDENGDTQIVDQNHLPEGADYIPLMQWKGRPSEGAIVTLMRFAQIAAQGDPETGEKGIWAAIHNYQNAKDVDKALYRNNLGQLLYDFIGYLFVGIFFAPLMVSLAEDFSKDIGDESLVPAFIGSSFTIGAEWLKASGDDFNPIISLGGRGLTWTPFSLQTLQRVGKNVGGVIGGSKDGYDALINTFGATRATKPVWNVVKLDLLGREIGDKGE